MPYITRDDGEHFVIPSYRDVLIVNQKSQLKKEILLLSKSYGEYITLQKKSGTQYEVAFSPEAGYLLGESIWHHFKKPVDMIYCEAIPNTTEAILVIVKSGSVYLDGSFQIDSIPEELIIFLTQQNNFEIYVHGDVPISHEPEEGKFSFEANSVKSFTVLDDPVFPSLPLLRIYQLQLVDPVLKEQGIGVFPTKQLITFVIIAGLIWMGYKYLFPARQVVVAPKEVANPFQAFLNTLQSPAPDKEIASFVQSLQNWLQIPGWVIKDIKYGGGSMTATVFSTGGKIENLFTWAKANNSTVTIKKTGIELTQPVTLVKRDAPKNIYSVKEVVAILVDRLADIYPGNQLVLGEFLKKNVYTSVGITLNLHDVTPAVLALIGEQLVDLPLVIHGISVSLNEGGSLSGSITMEALGE